MPPELGGLGFSEKLVYLPHSYQVNDYNISYEFCGGGEALRGCQQSVRQVHLHEWCLTEVLLRGVFNSFSGFESSS